MTNIVAEHIELRTQDDAKVMIMSQVEKFPDGSGYRCELRVISDGFSCKRPFFFEGSFLSDAVTMLRKMNDGTPGEATIKGMWEEDQVKFTLDKLGHIVVSGQVFERSEYPQEIRFAFPTDQTVLSPLVNDLTRLLEA